MSRIARVVVRKSMNDRDDDRLYWLAMTPGERIAVLAQMRREFEGWTIETEPGLPRVARVLRPS